MKTRNIIFLAALIVVQSAIFLATYWVSGQEVLVAKTLSLQERLIAAACTTALSAAVLYPTWRNIFIVKRDSSKTSGLLVIAVITTALFSSCASTQQSYAEVGGKLTSLQRSRATNYVAVQRVQRIESTEARYAELDFKRLQSQSVMADSVKGYMGKIMNLTRWTNIQFNVVSINAYGQPGRTVLSEVLAPGQQITRHLLPGRYSVSVIINGRLRDEKSFYVSAELKSVFGEPLHWFVFRDER
jgi:hypothetical protein